MKQKKKIRGLIRITYFFSPLNKLDKKQQQQKKFALLEKKNKIN